MQIKGNRSGNTQKKPQSPAQTQTKRSIIPHQKGALKLQMSNRWGREGA